MKIGKNLPVPDQPRLVDAPRRPERDEAVAASVAASPTAETAWDALGPRDPKKAEALSQELRRLHLAVGKGRRLVAEGKPLTPAVTARFTELHLERLELRWRLEAAVFPGRPLAPTRLAALCDEEVAAVLGASAHRAAAWPDDYVQKLMRVINGMVRDGASADAVMLGCEEMVRAACEHAYGARDNTEEGADGA